MLQRNCLSLLIGFGLYLRLLPFIAVNLKTSHEPAHDKTNKMACAPNEDSDKPGHPPSLIRVFAVLLLGS